MERLGRERYYLKVHINRCIIWTKKMTVVLGEHIKQTCQGLTTRRSHPELRFLGDN